MDKTEQETGGHMHGKVRIVRLLGYAGVVLATLGVLATASVVWTILFTQSLCQGGSSPQPVQGCGYVPQLVMFNWGPNNQFPILVDGIYLVYVGLALLALDYMLLRKRYR
jgi:hypothetical protein